MQKGEDCASVAVNNKCSHLFIATRQIKVVIIGKANIGKTSIVKRMKEDWGLFERVKTAMTGFGKREPTDGIQIHSWTHPKIQNVTLHLRDFAGQVKNNINSFSFFTSTEYFSLSFVGFLS